MVAEQESMQHGHAPQRYVQCCWSISRASSSMSLLCMSHTDMYVHDIRFIPLTCMSHATKYPSAPTYPLTPLGAHYLPPAPLDDKEQNLVGVQHTWCFIRHLLQCLD